MGGLGRTALFVSSAMMCVAATPALAQTKALDVPAQPAATALGALGHQADVEIVGARRVTHGKQTNAVHGNLTVDAALSRMLAGTGLVARRTGPQSYVVVSSAATDAAPAPEEPQPAVQMAPAAPGATAATNTDQNQLGDIIVTAARRTQNLQKVSAAVKVLEGADIQKQGLTNVGQLFSNLPSVQATGQPGGFSVDVRGLGGDLPAGTTQGSVAMVFDGIYNINSQGTTVGLFDVDRVEVLPGPQSTRYGPNADGGIVNVITNDPKLDRYSGQGSITVGNYDLVRGEFAVNVPIGQTVALRVAGATLSRGSYFTPAEGKQSAQSIRAKLLFQPSDAFKLKLTYELDHIGGEGDGSNTFPVFTNKVPVYSGDDINKLNDPWSQSPSDPINATTANINQQTFGGYLTYDFSPAVALDVVGSYTKLHGGGTATIYLPPWSTGEGIGYGPVVQGADTDEFAPFHQFTGEVRLHNGSDSRVTWNLGFYHWNYFWQYQLANASFLSTPPLKTTTSTNAVYGEVTYPVTDRFRLIGGARESWDKRTFNFNNSGTLTPVFGISFSHFDYRAGAEYDLTPTSMLYATASTGYRPGGLSSYNPVTDAPNTFKSEVNRAFEFGSKNRFFDNRLQVNASVFYYKMDNYQNLDKYTGFVPPEGGAPCANGDTRAGCVTPTFGVAAHTLGAELDVDAKVTRNDLLNLTGTWLDAKFDKNQGTCATVGLPADIGPGCWDGYNSQAPYDPGAPFFFNISGTVQPHSPKFSGRVSYTHIFNFSSGATLSIGGDAFYSTGYWVNPVEDASFYGYQPAYWLENVQATFTSADEHFSLTAFARNLSDYAVKESVLPATSISAPLTFGLTAGFKL